MAEAPATGIALQHGERRIRLKWHMLRRAFDDPPHARHNLATGLGRGAVVEVDLRFSADGQGFCIHDETLEAETTGRGPVCAWPSHEIAALRQRGAGGAVLDAPPLTLREVVEGVLRSPPSARGAVQLDLKAERLDAQSLGHFAELVAPLAAHFTVSGEDFALVEALVRAAPGLRPGFEPLPLFRHDPPRDAEGFRQLAARILAAAPGAEIVYLHAGLALAALSCGEDLVSRMRDAGREVDCWTIDPQRSQVAETLRRLAEAGCGQITTNGPEALEACWLRAAEQGGGLGSPAVPA